MQIEVVDDCSNDVDVAVLVKGIAGTDAKLRDIGGRRIGWLRRPRLPLRILTIVHFR
jgi:hypothetical protein